ncbi:MAG: DNA integrity scanning protein DisA nucleotide-binding domain protein [Nitrospirae bacterium]|nr:DNA integrity scanning protein DisA nucleotide-binding domain protein [Nitrospirota bacterium]
MKDQKISIIKNAVDIARETNSQCVFLFLDTAKDCRWFLKAGISEKNKIVLVIPRELKMGGPLSKDRIAAIRSWAGNQTRFSRIKYAFLHGVAQEIIQTDSRVVCVLGPWGKSHLDTIAIHDLSLSWSEDFPFDPRSIMHNKAFKTILAVIDIALDIGALGREGKPVGTTFVIGDMKRVLQLSHQAVFNPFKGYSPKERLINRSEVVESMKELAKLDGAFIISDTGIVEAAGRHLDARSVVTRQLKGFGSRHRAAAGITKMTGAVAVVVSESTGRVTIFENGRIVSTLEPLISTRLV